MDKHLLPVESFYDKRTGKDVEGMALPYSTVDLVFNHKNVWANLQNPSPTHIHFHLHNEREWLPLITDLLVPHPLAREEATKRKVIKETLMDFKTKGDFMKPFVSFFDPKTMDMAFPPNQIERFEASIYKEVETSIKQVRSSQNLSTKVRKNAYTTRVLQSQLEFFEDVQCERFSSDEAARAGKRVRMELLKLIPEGYKL